MTAKKKPPIKVVDIAKGPPPSKPTQIERILPRQEPVHIVVDNISYYIGKRAAERAKEKEK